MILLQIWSLPCVFQDYDNDPHLLPGCLADNHWAANGGPYTFPINIRLTSVRNDTVLDVLPSLSGGQVGISGTTLEKLTQYTAAHEAEKLALSFTKTFSFNHSEHYAWRGCPSMAT